MPTVLVTRRLPSSVLARLEAACTLDLYTGRDAIPREELLRRIAGKDAIFLWAETPSTHMTIAFVGIFEQLGSHAHTGERAAQFMGDVEKQAPLQRTPFFGKR